jgi:hypothetical protein
MGTDSPSVPVTVADALPNLRTGRLARGDDLTNNRPAKHLLDERRAYSREHASAIMRGRLSGNPDERHRALSRRIAGARAVAQELWELVAHRPVWRVLHSIRMEPLTGSGLRPPSGSLQRPSTGSIQRPSTGSIQRTDAVELDQLVIGPSGVYTIQSVYRPTHDITAETALYAAARTQEVLDRATRVPVIVQPLIVFVRADQPRVEGPRGGVEVLTANELVPWLEGRRSMLTERELEIVHLAARDHRTWAV